MAKLRWRRPPSRSSRSSGRSEGKDNDDEEEEEEEADASLMICSLVITLGGAPDHHRRGFEYWRNPGPFVQFQGISGALGRFLGFFLCVSKLARG